MNSSSDEFGACAESARPAACGSDEPDAESDESATANAEQAGESSATNATEDSITHVERNSEDNEELAAGNRDEDASTADIASATGTANSLQNAMKDHAAQSDENQSSTQAGQRTPSSPGGNDAESTTDSTDRVRKIDLELKTSQSPHANALAVAAQTQVSENFASEGSHIGLSSADSDKTSRKTKHQRHGFNRNVDAAGHDRAVTTGTGSAESKRSDVAADTGRTTEKLKSSEDSRRRTNEKGEPRGAQRTESAANATPATGNAVVSDVRVDAATAPTKGAEDESTPKAVNTSGAKSDLLVSSLARANRGHGASGHANRAENESALPRVDATRFVGRVAKAIQTANERGGALQLRLSPPELGALRLQLTVHDGVMSASLEAENPAARQLLLDHLPSLRDRLAEQNIRIDRFDVDVRQEGSGGQADSRTSQHEQRQQNFQHSTPRRETAHAANGDVAGSEPITLPQLTNNGLNVLA